MTKHKTAETGPHLATTIIERLLLLPAPNHPVDRNWEPGGWRLTAPGRLSEYAGSCKFAIRCQYPDYQWCICGGKVARPIYTPSQGAARWFVWSDAHAVDSERRWWARRNGMLCNAPGQCITTIHHIDWHWLELSRMDCAFTVTHAPHSGSHTATERWIMNTRRTSWATHVVTYRMHDLQRVVSDIDENSVT